LRLAIRCLFNQIARIGTAQTEALDCVFSCVFLFQLEANFLSCTDGAQINTRQSVKLHGHTGPAQFIDRTMRYANAIFCSIDSFNPAAGKHRPGAALFNPYRCRIQPLDAAGKAGFRIQQKLRGSHDFIAFFYPRQDFNEFPAFHARQDFIDTKFSVTQGNHDAIPIRRTDQRFAGNAECVRV